MDIEPPSSPLGYILFSTVILFSSGLMISILLLLILIISSAMISGSEIAFFSLSPSNMAELTDEESKSSKRIIALKEKPRTLLATILIANNFVNIAIVIVSDYLIKQMIGEAKLAAIGNWLYNSGLSWLGNPTTLASGFNLLITVVGVTFILVLFGEIAPKLYANLNNMKFARVMSGPLTVLNSIFGVFSNILVRWSNNIENRITHSNNNQNHTLKEDIDAAIDLTVNSEEEHSEEEADILKGIVKFGDVSTKQIMKPRVDVVSLDIKTKFEEVVAIIKENGYSRIPVFEDGFDNLIGILYVKDLIGYSDQKNDFDWTTLIRKSILYVPESKKIDDLLREFQVKRTHIAIVVDEYGGSSGIVTLEDVMEEVIGDIKDEFDEEEEVDYVELSTGNYIFEGKSLLNDVCRIIGVETTYFDDAKGEADSLAGLIIEIEGLIPKPETEIKVRDVLLKIVSVSKRRIEKVNLRLED